MGVGSEKVHAGTSGRGRTESNEIRFHKGLPLIASFLNT